jgi:glycine/D-amino acid oxidase-like deaminating enzyme
VLAEAGRSVAVLEAAGIGHGASGRNGGLVVPSLPRVGPLAVLRALGPAHGERLLRLVADGAEHVFALIRDRGIDCDARQTGWLNPAHAAMLAPGLVARAAEWRSFGGRAEMLDAAETRRRMGSARFHGALFDRSGGHLNPLGYTRGLARAAIRAGAAVFTDTQVIAVRSDAGWTLQTPRGVLRARIVLQCGNVTPPGLPGPAARRVRDSLVPLTVYQMATDPLPAAIRARVLAGDEAFSDTRNNLLACRWDAQGRLVTGAMASLQAGAIARLPRAAAKRLAAVFPALTGIAFSQVWRGRAALTGDFLPRLFQAADGWLAPIGCNGRGIALSTGLGEALGRFILTGDPACLPVPVTAPAPRVLAGLLPMVPQLLLPVGDWQDRRRERP